MKPTLSTAQRHSKLNAFCIKPLITSKVKMFLHQPTLPYEKPERLVQTTLLWHCSAKWSLTNTTKCARMMCQNVHTPRVYSAHLHLLHLNSCDARTVTGIMLVTGCNLLLCVHIDLESSRKWLSNPTGKSERVSCDGVICVNTVVNVSLPVLKCPPCCIRMSYSICNLIPFVFYHSFSVVSHAPLQG